MERSRIAVLVAAAISVAAALFALGAAVTSVEDDSVAAPTSTAAVAITAASGSNSGGADSVPAPSAPAAGATFDIEIAGFEFGPAEATVAVGTTVTWTNNDGFEHTIVSETGAFDPSPTMAEGDTFSFTFTEPGTYAYVCGIHPQMRGTIVVEG